MNTPQLASRRPHLCASLHPKNPIPVRHSQWCCDFNRTREFQHLLVECRVLRRPPQQQTWEEVGKFAANPIAMSRTRLPLHRVANNAEPSARQPSRHEHSPALPGWSGSTRQDSLRRRRPATQQCPLPDTRTAQFRPQIPLRCMRNSYVAQTDFPEPVMLSSGVVSARFSPRRAAPTFSDSARLNDREPDPLAPSRR